MRIEAVEAIPLVAAFRTTFRFGTTDRTTSPNVVVVIRSSDGVAGHGEACPVPAFTRETQRSVVDLVERHVAPVLVGRDPRQRGPLLRALAPVLAGAPFTASAVDTALLDLVGRSLGVPVSTLLGGAFRDRIEVHGSVGWDEDAGRMADSALRQRDAYRWLKTYAGRGALDADLERLAAIRRTIGPDLHLMLDVNGLWTPDGLLRALPRLAELGIEVLEQPLPPGTTGRSRPWGVSIVADEAVRTVEDAVHLVGDGWTTAINVGHSKLGGPSAAHQAAQLAVAAGLDVLVGSVLELGIGNAMGLHLAAALPVLRYPSYLIGPLKYREQITAPATEVVAGHVAVPDGPGLGIEVDEEALRALDARRRP